MTARSRALVMIAVVIAVCIAYSPALRAPFLFDDIASIPDNITIRTLWPPSATLHPPPGIAVSGRPAVNYSLALDYAINERLGVDQRPDPDGANKTVTFHLTNLLLHFACGALLLGLLRRTLGRGGLAAAWAADADAIALAVTALWLLHPIQTEVVNYVIQRTESIVSVCYLGTLYSAVRAWDASTARARIGWYATAIFVCLLGMGSKEVMLTAPLMVLLYDRAFRSSSWREVVRASDGRRWFYLLLVATSAVSVWFILTGPRADTVGFSHGMSWYSYLYSQAWAIAHYLQLVFWPSQLAYDYGQRPIAGLRGVPGLVLLTAMGIATIVAWKRDKPLAFLGAWFFVILAPSSSFVPLTKEIAAERRFYLPLIAVLVLIAVGATRLRRHFATRSPRERTWLQELAGRHQGWIVAGLCVLLTAATFQRSRLYADPVALWRDAAAKRPDNARAFDNLASSMLERDPSRLAEAEAALRQAVAVDSSYLPALPNLAFVLEQQGRFPEARSLLERALAINPDYVRVVERLGHVLVAMGEPEAALPHLERVVNEFPSDDNLVALGTAYLHLGRLDDATATLRRALQLNPARTDAMTYIGVLLIEQERGADAVPVLEEAVRLEPGAGLALAALALAYAKSGRGDDAARLALTAGKRAAGDVTVYVLAGRALLLSRHPVEAGQLMEEAVRISPTDPEMIVRLGAIKVALGMRDQAAQLFQRALSIDPNYVPAKRALEDLARSPRQ